MNCHRHTVEEIQKWCFEAGLRIDRMKVEEAGITVVAQKVVRDDFQHENNCSSLKEYGG